ncbi:hypothetical protein GMLC_30970 [Geomonas limicola]|uniref:4Fe-4S ferredoxin-type domain-containing protein n=1 Tax=Geomonas limicola TaxID=2740186 RepID=A0A6V8NA99_9BACT|nr:4Fe-4S binding protein [Geomonas limicola]GFO69518.1 hypothetical protein GMLC_30970 [Geomonas limicola]
MTLTRKEFLRQGAASLGRAALDLAGALQASTGELPKREPEEPALERGAHLVAAPQGSECFAASCGCLSCLERCERQAISLVIGQGLRIDAELCNGCAVCVEICPTTPRSLVMVPRPSEQDEDAAVLASR